MKPDTPSHCIDFSTLSPHQRYKILIGSIVPRPIAWVTTVDPEGRVNAAPFSFFNALSADPPWVGLGVQRRQDGGPKDTLRNIEATGVFTVNVVADALVEAMNVCAVAFPADIDELAAAGLEAQPGAVIAAPWIAQAPVALECRKVMIVPTGPRGDIVLAEVVLAHIRADLCDPAQLHIDPFGLDAVGRMGGQGYARTRDYFDLAVKSPEEFHASPDGGVRHWPSQWVTNG